MDAKTPYEALSKKLILSCACGWMGNKVAAKEDECYQLCCPNCRERLTAKGMCGNCQGAGYHFYGMGRDCNGDLMVFHNVCGSCKGKGKKRV